MDSVLSVTARQKRVLGAGISGRQIGVVDASYFDLWIAIRRTSKYVRSKIQLKILSQAALNRWTFRSPKAGNVKELSGP
jgi:hypothetical protein